MHCIICRWTEGGHDPQCPRELTPDQKKRYRAGWIDGRNYRSVADKNDPIYGFGHVNGDIAADEWWNC